MNELHKWCRSILEDNTTDYWIRTCASQLLKCDKVRKVQAWIKLNEPPPSASAWYACHKAREFIGLAEEATP